MSNRGALIVAAALTAFVLVVAGGIVGRLSKPAVQAGRSSPAQVVVAQRGPQPRPLIRPAMQTWRDDGDDDDHERRAPEGRRPVEAEHEDDDD